MWVRRLPLRASRASLRPITARYFPAPHTPTRGRVRPTYVVRDRVTHQYWCDPWAIVSQGDPRREWRPRRYAYHFPTRDAAAARVRDVGAADRVDVVEVDPPPCRRAARPGGEYLQSATIAECNYLRDTCRVQLLPATSISALAAVRTLNLGRASHAQPRP